LTVAVVERALALLPEGSDGHPYLQGIRGDLTVVEVEDTAEVRRVVSLPWHTVVVARAGAEGLDAARRTLAALPPDGHLLVDLRDAGEAAPVLRPLVPTEVYPVGSRVVVRFERAGRIAPPPLEEQVARLAEEAVARSRAARELVDLKEPGTAQGGGVRARAVAVSRGIAQLGGIGLWWLRSRRARRHAG
jgi:hypothetical protein